MNWAEYSKAFEWDRSWRDLYVLHTNTGDWQKLLDFLREGAYPVVFELDGRDLPFPAKAAPLFESRGEIAPFLRVTVGEIALNCHFFDAHEIEFELDPREVDGEEKLHALFAFMRDVARLLDKAVILTPENAQTSVVFRAAPDGEAVQYDPAAWDARPAAGGAEQTA